MVNSAVGRSVASLRRARGLLERQGRDVRPRTGAACIAAAPHRSARLGVRACLYHRRDRSVMPFGLTTPGGQPVGVSKVPCPAPPVRHTPVPLGTARILQYPGHCVLLNVLKKPPDANPLGGFFYARNTFPGPGPKSVERHAADFALM